MTESFKPQTISRFKKERFLLQMSEDQFRDEVVRPLFFRQGLRDGRDLCGPFERGKDAAFVAVDGLGIEDLYVLQTKKGNLNLAKKAQSSLIEAITQVRTALQTRVTFIITKEKKFPSKVILCASGKINDSARSHVVDEVNDPRIVFMDSDELIPRIDEIYPELWFGIDAEIGPYFRKLKQNVENSNESLAIVDLLPNDGVASAATEEGWVQIQLYRTVLKKKKVKGQVGEYPDFQQMPVSGILTKRERLFLVLGDAGSGKSTALKRLAYLLVEKGLKFEATDIQIPVMIRALDLANNSELVVVAAEQTKKLTNSNNPSFSSKDLVNGRVTLLVDALDELPDDDGRTTVLKSILKFHSLYPDCQIIVTSRNYSFIKTLEEFRIFERFQISPIDYHQAEKIVSNLQKGRTLAKEKSRAILRRLDQVHGIELNPLLVTVFAATSDYSRQDVPANITELFKKFTEMMLGRWDASKGLAQQYHGPLKDFVLTKIAFEMHRRQETNISVEEFEDIIEKELNSRGHKADVPLLLDEILNRSGLLRVIDNLIEFRHLLLQEFFAGRGIPSIEFIETVVDQDWWQRAIVFYFGANPSDGKSLESVKQSLTLRTPEETYSAARTLGLALQACYLVELKDKIDIYRWVVVAFAEAKNTFLENDIETEHFPLGRFLYYYLVGRDSVALSVLEPKLDEIITPWHEGTLTHDERDARIFWVIIGLIESGSLAKVETMLKTFRPSDSKLLLGIYLGCYLTQQLRVLSKEQDKIAKRIIDNLSAKVEELRKQLLKEVKTELLELRAGTIAEIEPDAL